MRTGRHWGVQGGDSGDVSCYLATEHGGRPASVPRLSQAPGSGENRHGHLGQPWAITRTDPSEDGAVLASGGDFGVLTLTCELRCV